MRLDQLPPERQLSAEQMALRKAHLLQELDASGEGWKLGRPLRRRSAAVLILAGGAAVLALPAFGVVDRILDAFTGTPATPLIQEKWSRLNEGMARADASAAATLPADRLAGRRSWPPVDPADVRGILAYDTGEMTLRLWAAVNAAGGQCWTIQMGESESGTLYGPAACQTQRTAPPVSGIKWDSFPNSFLTSKPRIVIGKVFVDAERVAVSFADGTVATAPVIEGFFLLTARETSMVTKVEALDGEGTIVAESSRGGNVVNPRCALYPDWVGASPRERCMGPPPGFGPPGP
jgi:hypothetical protein